MFLGYRINFLRQYRVILLFFIYTDDNILFKTVVFLCSFNHFIFFIYITLLIFIYTDCKNLLKAIVILFLFKGALSLLRKILAAKIPLKITENAFYFTLTAFFVLKIFKFLS